MTQEPHTTHVSSGSESIYIIGYVVSVVLTGVAFFLVHVQMVSNAPLLPHSMFIGILLGLGILQLIIQLICFLHLDQESQPRWRLVAFIFAAIFVIAVVAGSLWIMANLNYNMGMTPTDMDTYMLDQ